MVRTPSPSRARDHGCDPGRGSGSGEGVGVGLAIGYAARDCGSSCRDEYAMSGVSLIGSPPRPCDGHHLQARAYVDRGGFQAAPTTLPGPPPLILLSFGVTSFRVRCQAQYAEPGGTRTRALLESQRLRRIEMRGAARRPPARNHPRQDEHRRASHSPGRWASPPWRSSPSLSASARRPGVPRASIR